ARHCDKSDLEAIARAEAAMRAESELPRPDLPRAVELNKTFHFAVYEAAQSPITVEIIRALWLKAGPVINLDLRANPDRLAKGDAIRFHADVRQAIEAGDCAAAQAGIAADLKAASDFIPSRGGLDVLVNNAGVAGPTAKVEEMNPEDWDRCLQICLTGQFNCTRLAVPHLRKSNNASIVNISSAAGRLGFAMRTPYAAAKWGVI